MRFHPLLNRVSAFAVPIVGMVMLPLAGAAMAQSPTAAAIYESSHKIKTNVPGVTARVRRAACRLWSAAGTQPGHPSGYLREMEESDVQCRARKALCGASDSHQVEEHANEGGPHAREVG
jgi:hypothetical protein